MIALCLLDYPVIALINLFLFVVKMDVPIPVPASHDVLDYLITNLNLGCVLQRIHVIPTPVLRVRDALQEDRSALLALRSLNAVNMNASHVKLSVNICETQYVTVTIWNIPTFALCIKEENNCHIRGHASISANLENQSVDIMAKHTEMYAVHIMIGWLWITMDDVKMWEYSQTTIFILSVLQYSVPQFLNLAVSQ